MGQAKRIMISIPQSLLEEVDGMLCKEKCNRSEFIRKAMTEYIKERSTMAIREQMVVGYTSMASINKELCEEGICDDSASLSRYELLLAESVRRDS